MSILKIQNIKYNYNVEINNNKVTVINIIDVIFDDYLTWIIGNY